MSDKVKETQPFDYLATAEFKHRSMITTIDRDKQTEADLAKGIIRGVTISLLVVDSDNEILWFPKTTWRGTVYEATPFVTFANPPYVPLLWMHGRGQRWIQPIGVMLGDWRIIGDGVSPDTRWEIDMQFILEEKRLDENAGDIFAQMRDGFLRMNSIGYRDKAYLTGDEANAFLEENKRPERGVNVSLGIVLGEDSICTWGANPGAHTNAGSPEFSMSIRSALKDPSLDLMTRAEWEREKKELINKMESIVSKAKGSGLTRDEEILLSLK